MDPTQKALIMAAIEKAKSIDEVHDAVSKASAAADKANAILYSAFGDKTSTVIDLAKQLANYALLDDTDRADILQDERFLAKVGELVGLSGEDVKAIANMVRNPERLEGLARDLAQQANELIFGKEGYVESLKNSFWGRASREFAQSVPGKVLAMMGRDVKKILQEVELPTLLEDRAERIVNDIPLSELPADPAAALDQLKQSALKVGGDMLAAASAAIPPIPPLPEIPELPKIPEAPKMPSVTPPSGGGPPAARITDMHTCPMVSGVVPHVGGPIITGMPTVMTGKLLQARVTDLAVCAGGPDTIIKASATVMVGKLPAARIGDMTVHGGIIVTGLPTVLIGG